MEDLLFGAKNNSNNITIKQLRIHQSDRKYNIYKSNANVV